MREVIKMTKRRFKKEGNRLVEVVKPEPTPLPEKKE